jgi:hypothetical protein
MASNVQSTILRLLRKSEGGKGMKTKMSGLRMVLVALAVLMIPSITLAAYYEFTDSTGILGVRYAVNILGTAGTITAYTDGATLPSSSDWYIDAILLKVTDKKLTNVNLTSTTNLNDSWSATTSASPVNLQKFANDVPNDGWTLFYTSGVQVSSTGNASSGASVNGGSYTWAFSFDLGTSSYIDPSSMQVLYYGGTNSASGQYETKRMSQSASVPEPSMLVLLGLALIAVAVFSKRLKLV